jgi:hypothetical protein
VSAPSVRPADRELRTVLPVSAYRTGEPVWVWTTGRWATGLVLAAGPAAGLVLAGYCRGDGELTERTFPPLLIAPRMLPAGAGGPGGAAAGGVR